MKAFFFSVITILLFSLLIALSAVGVANSSSEAVQLLAAGKAVYAWYDIAEDVQYSLKLNITKSAENATFSDVIPAQVNVSDLLAAYEKFVQAHYSSTGLNASFNPALASMQPPIEIMPFGVTYGYPDWGKHELYLNSPSENFSYITNLTLFLNITSHWFDQNFTGKCSGGGSDWNSYKTCNGGTTYCLNLDLKIEDANGTVYDSNCTPMDLDTQNVLWLNLANGTDSPKINLQFGKMADTVFYVDLSKTTISINSTTTITFNTSAYDVRLKAYLRTAIEAMNYSVNRQITT